MPSATETYLKAATALNRAVAIDPTFAPGARPSCRRQR